MTDPRPDRPDPVRRESPPELAEEAREENPDPTTRREAYELGLMEQGESDAGAEIEVVDPDE